MPLGINGVGADTLTHMDICTCKKQFKKSGTLWAKASMHLVKNNY